MTNAGSPGTSSAASSSSAPTSRPTASNETRYVEADAGNFVVFRDLPGSSRAWAKRELAGPDRLLAGIRPRRVQLAPNVDFAGGLVGEQPHARRAGADREPLPEHGHLRRPCAGQPAPADQRPDGPSSARTMSTTRASRRACSAASRSTAAGRSSTRKSSPAPMPRRSSCPAVRRERSNARSTRTGAASSFSRSGVTLTADYRHDDANQPIFRTDYINRDRYKFRAVWNYKDFLRLGAFFQETHADDDIVQIGYSTQVREFMADFEVTLLKNLLTLRGSGRRVPGRPGDPDPGSPGLRDRPHRFREELGHVWEGGVHFQWERLTLDGGYLWMNNNGSIPFTVGRTRVLAEFFFTQNIGADLRVAPGRLRRARGLRPGGPPGQLQRKPLLRRLSLASLNRFGHRISRRRRKHRCPSPVRASGWLPSPSSGRMGRHFLERPSRCSRPEASQGRRHRRQELPVLPHRRNAEEGIPRPQRPGQVAGRGERQARRQDGRRRVAEGLPGRQEVKIRRLAAVLFFAAVCPLRRGPPRLRRAGAPRLDRNDVAVDPGRRARLRPS